MKIGIDISQTAFEKTGVANLLTQLLTQLFEEDNQNEYVLFYSSLRREIPSHWKELLIDAPNLSLKTFKFPPKFLSLLWNTLHVFPIECFIGDVDVFITSDWTEPPVRQAKKITILYDLVVYTAPEETDQKIRETQYQKLAWVKKESDMILCISEATKKDAERILNIEANRLKVVYPGVTL